MSKLEQVIQGGAESYIFKCYCGENSYLEISGWDENDKLFPSEVFFTITIHPTRLKERLKLAWKALRGLEFGASNQVLVMAEDLPKMVEAIQNFYKPAPTNDTESNKEGAGNE